MTIAVDHAHNIRTMGGFIEDWRETFFCSGCKKRLNKNCFGARYWGNDYCEPCDERNREWGSK